MEAWRTSCPRFPIWEDTNDRGLVELDAANGHTVVRVTTAGLSFFKQHRRRAFDELQRQRDQEGVQGAALET